MKNRSGEKIKLASIDELLGVVNEESAMEIEISKIHPFKNHPFKVLDDEKMQDLVESVRINGVLTPVLLRMDDNEEYEMVSGHRRMHAAQLAGLTTIPAIVRELSDDDAIVAMVDANIQREELLPSEKAFAYKMKLEAMKRQGVRTDLTLSQNETKLRSDEVLSKLKIFIGNDIVNVDAFSLCTGLSCFYGHRNHIFKYFYLASVGCMYSRCNVPCVIGSEINHSQQNALNRQFPVQPFLYCKNGLDQLLKSFHRQICGLYRYQHGIGRDQCIDCHHTKTYENLVKETIDYESLEVTHHDDMRQVDEIVNLIVETVMCKNDKILIASNWYPASLVKKKFLMLTYSHIEYVLHCMSGNTTKVKNIKKYLLAALFNAPSTMNGYYQAEVTMICQDW